MIISRLFFFFFLFKYSVLLRRKTWRAYSKREGKKKRKVTASAGWLALGWFYWQILNELDGDWLCVGRKRFSCSPWNSLTWELHTTGISHTHICMHVYYLQEGVGEIQWTFQNIEMIKFSVAIQSSSDWICARRSPSRLKVEEAENTLSLMVQ